MDEEMFKERLGKLEKEEKMELKNALYDLQSKTGNGWTEIMYYI